MEEESAPDPSNSSGEQRRKPPVITGLAGETTGAFPSSMDETVLAPSPQFERIGDFEVLGKLGQGGMGAVYRARQISLDRLVALKILPATLEADAEFVTRFQREARIAASLSHANLVKVYSSGLADGSHFIAMELVEGETLGQLVRRGPLPPPDALRICLDVARALQCGWDKAHLIHRDIKPGNIFLSERGEVKVGDLGLAKSMAGDTTGLTNTGTAMGTPHYISPEQANGEKDLDFRADIYSLGCTLFQMLTGQTPYAGTDALAVMSKHRDAPPPAILKVLPSCPIPLAMLVGKMLKKAKRERHGSYGELISQIESVQAIFAPQESALETMHSPDPDATLMETPGALVRSRTATRSAAKTQRSRSVSKVWAYGVLFGAIILCVVAFFLFRSNIEEGKWRHSMSEQSSPGASFLVLNESEGSKPQRQSPGAYEPWQNLLRDPANLFLSKGARMTPDGLRFVSSGSALSEPLHNAAVRIRTSSMPCVRNSNVVPEKALGLTIF